MTKFTKIVMQAAREGIKKTVLESRMYNIHLFALHDGQVRAFTADEFLLLREQKK